MNHLMNVLEGIASVFDFVPRARDGRTRGGGFAGDQERMRSDVRKVGDELRKAARTYGKQGGQGSR